MVTLSTGFGEELSALGYAVSGVALLTAFNLTNGLSRIVAGALSDRIGREVLGAGSFFLAAASYLALPHTQDPVALAVLCAVIGFAFGTLFAITAPLGTDLFGLKHFGLIFGLIFTAYGFVGGLVGPLLSSAVLGAFTPARGALGAYSVVFTYLGVFCMLAALFVLMVRRPRAELAVEHVDAHKA